MLNPPIERPSDERTASLRSGQPHEMAVPKRVLYSLYTVVEIIMSLPFVSFYLRYLVLTTSSGIMDHEEARRKHTGGKILGFFY